MNEQEIKTKNVEVEDGGLSLEALWSLFILNWQIVILSVFFFLGCGVIYLRYTRPAYQAQMTVLFKENDTRRRMSNMVNGFALDQIGLVNNTNGFENEVEIISSTSIARRVVQSLKLYTNYYMEGRIKDQELYTATPILADLEEQDFNALESTLKLVVSKNGKGYSVDGEIYMEDEDAGKMEKVKFTRELKSIPGTIKTPAGTVIFQKNVGFEWKKDRDIIIYISPLEAVCRAYVKSLQVTPTSKMTTVADISIVDLVPERAADYLRELAKAYNEDANEDKNEVARKTEEFIRERIDVIRQELDETENHMEDFKKSNELINLANDATVALTSSTQYQAKQVEMQTQLLLVKSLVDYMKNPANAKEVIPANLGLESKAVADMISNYNQLVLDRSRLLKNSSEENPIVQRLDVQIAQLWPAIGQSLESVYKDMLQQKDAVDSQYGFYRGRVVSTPNMEHVFNNIARQQEIKSGLYLTLLQKREENYIALASTAAKARVINQPEKAIRISPKKAQVLLICLVLGGVLPMGILYLLSIMRYRIEGRNDIERLTKLSILADIPLSYKLKEGQRAVVVRENKNDMMEEAFRGLRTNVKFLLRSNEKVLMVTSVIPAEGKTFVSTNLAMSIALLGKKVLVIGLDIRKPQLVKLFGLPADKRGISNFLALDQPDMDYLEDQIHRGVLNPNLDVLPAGIIPPNPAELVARQMLDDAFNYLRTRYDYIIVDTPPIGLVSDSLSIARVVDLSLIVARADYSPKSNFMLINSASNEGKLPKVSIVLNGVDMKKKKYGYYYGYGKYGRYGKYGKYGGKYGYGHYGLYGNYSSSTEGKSIKEKGADKK